jgi:hypothetical protein
LDAVERIAFNDDPLKLLVIQTSYQPFISLFHQTDMVHEHPELGAIRKFSLYIEPNARFDSSSLFLQPISGPLSQ